MGNVVGLAERENGGGTAARTFGYDGLDRLTSLKSGATTVQGFTYDATGNRTSKLSGTTAAYLYGTESHRLDKVGTVNRSYDAAGNSTAIGSKNYQYDDRGRMSRSLNGTTVLRDYQYNALGQRVAKIHPTTATSTVFFVYDEAGKVMGEYKPDGTMIREYLWLDDTLVAMRAGYAGHKFQYVLTDHLSTPRAVVLPSTNAIVWRWDLTGSAFGEHAAQNNPDGDGTNYMFNLRYPGQYFDAETGLHYNYFRDYEPGTGRYVQSDPIGLAGGVSTYGYVGGNPLSFVDPSGLELVSGNRRGAAWSSGPVGSLDGMPGYYPQERVLPGAWDLAQRLSRRERIPALDELDDGDNDCAELIKMAFPAPHSSQWQAFRKLAPGLDIRPGTFIFTPDAHGRFAQGEDDWRHAAIFVGYSANGILVIDQFDPRPYLQYRELPWHWDLGNPHATLVNSAENFYTGGW